jgi:isopenicillin-N epimerase
MEQITVTTPIICHFKHTNYGKITPMSNLKDFFLLDPNVTYLNHGSFGACPRPVFEAYQHWQRELERQPVAFIGQRVELMAKARARLANYLGVHANDVVYFPNPTTAINMVARNVKLQPGDEILATDHEYGAMDRTWRYVCKKAGAKYINWPIPLPLTTVEAFLETFWAGVTPHTKVIFISHITSPTALIFPVKEICQRARQAGILSIIDGAHAIGQVPLDLDDLGCDLYTGACHKWLCAPKGSAFLYARREVQSWLDPLVVSWGYNEDPAQGSYSSSRFIDYHEWQGTKDFASYLATPTAIDFQAEHGWDEVRKRCHGLGRETRQRIDALTGLSPICGENWFGQFFVARLPESLNPDALHQHLYVERSIVAPFCQLNNQKYIRVSFQGYNAEEDADILVNALAQYLSR